MLHPLPLSAYHYNIKEGAKVVVINMKKKRDKTLEIKPVSQNSGLFSYTS